MNISKLQTPAILVDLDAMDRNLKRYHGLAKEWGKQLWPMVKTHKSLQLAKIQEEYGATGFLCGTLDECEALQQAGFENIMYAYPVAGEVSVGRAVALAKKCGGFIIRLDNLEAARSCNEGAQKAGVVISYTIIVDSGLHRFGVPPEKAGELWEAMRPFGNLAFRGISTHPGHVYAASQKADVDRYVQDECSCVKAALASLEAKGATAELVTSGSTPTFPQAVKDPRIGIFHPGNYIFQDAIQLSTQTAEEADCALQVLATVVSRPAKDRLVCDAGSKCLGLDQGAHGNASIQGYGRVVGHPELLVEGLSEEVGKIHIQGETDLQVGDRIRIIPNHSCSAANMTDYLIGIRGDQVERVIPVEIRGNRTTKGLPPRNKHKEKLQ